MSPTPISTSAHTDPRREWGIIAALTLLAAVLRFWGFGRLGLTHFDEGVYALAGLWSLHPRGLAGLDPQVIAYAPPGFPILIGVAYAVLGVSDSAALLVAIASGVLSVPAAAWVGRRTFGPGAGAASAAFAALAVAHIAFSRKALTDAPFLLAWLVAVGLGGRFLERPTFARALAMGVAVGLAQNFKYNGWVAGLVVIAAALAGLAQRDQRRPTALARTFGLGLVGAFVAGACYWPWYVFVENHGGYADLVRHHRGYLGGFRSWRPFWETQLAQVVALSGGPVWGVVTWLAAWLAVTACGAVSWSTRWDRAGWRVGTLLGAAVVGAVPDLGWWAGLILVGPLLSDNRPAPRVLGSWWLILSVMTPFYHPYSRLWLPLHAAGWLFLAGAVVRLGPFSGSTLTWATCARGILTRLGLGLAVVLMLANGHWWSRAPHALPLRFIFGPTDGLRDAVSDLTPAAREPRVVDPDELAIVRVLGRRPLAYYLLLRSRSEIHLLADESGLRSLPVRHDEGALVDETGEVQGKPWITGRADVLRLWSVGAVWETQIDAVTLLDVNPDAAYTDEPNGVPLVLLRPKRQELPR